MKAIGIPHHDWYFNYFLRWTFVEVCQSSQTHRFFLIQKGVLKVVLMSPNAIASFLQWWHTWNSFRLLTHHWEQISYKAHTLHHAWVITISTLMHEFQSSRNLLFITVVGRATLPSQVAHPSHILKASNSMQKGAIAQCMVPLYPFLLPPMICFVNCQARVLSMSFYFWNSSAFHLFTTKIQIKLINHTFSTSQASYILKLQCLFVCLCGQSLPVSTTCGVSLWLANQK
jgi:hypothetical protein